MLIFAGKGTLLVKNGQKHNVIYELSLTFPKIGDEIVTLPWELTVAPEIVVIAVTDWGLFGNELKSYVGKDVISILFNIQLMAQSSLSNEWTGENNKQHKA